MIPTKQQCMELFEKYVLLSNVREHCLSVATVAMYIGKRIKEQKNPDLNLDLVFATALFHDMGKSAMLPNVETPSEKYPYRPLTEEELQIWKELRQIAAEIQEKNPDKHVHETDVVAHLLKPLYPDFVKYIHQIGGTRDEIYFESGVELHITHYADWIMQGSNVVPFTVRLEYLFERYWNDLPEDQKQDRIKRELALETSLFEGLDITNQLDLSALNVLKTELFGDAADFEIGKMNTIG